MKVNAKVTNKAREGTMNVGVSWLKYKSCGQGRSQWEKNYW
jgi:hypothetical protein